MDEIEVKILEVNKEEIINKLELLGAKKVFEGVLESLFFDFENKLRNSGEIFRLRREGNKIFITHKKKIEIDKAKVMDETEVEVSDFNEAKKLIESLGFEVFTKLKKKRVSYKLKNVKFELDEYLGEHSFVPLFLEVEAESIEGIYESIEKLGFSKEDCKPWSTKDLIEHYSA